MDIARTLPHTLAYKHEKNKGYGGNQKSCYQLALREGGDIVIMVHPDYQYTPRLIPAMVSMIGSGLYHCVLASRWAAGGGPPQWGHALWSYVFIQFSHPCGKYLRGEASEYHTGYRAFPAELLERVPFLMNSETLSSKTRWWADLIYGTTYHCRVSCPQALFAEASSIKLHQERHVRVSAVTTPPLPFRLARVGCAGQRSSATWLSAADFSTG